MTLFVFLVFVMFGASGVFTVAITIYEFFPRYWASLVNKRSAILKSNRLFCIECSAGKHDDCDGHGCVCKKAMPYIHYPYISTEVKVKD